MLLLYWFLLLHAAAILVPTAACCCRHLGVRVRAVLIAAVYAKALSVDMSASAESVGKLNNLISVDVGVSRPCSGTIAIQSG